jgi:hypothetical protein
MAVSRRFAAEELKLPHQRSRDDIMEDAFA